MCYSSEEADEEEDHYEEYEDEEDIRTKAIVSDHEFSPESDLEGEGEDSAEPIRRARTARKGKLCSIQFKILNKITHIAPLREKSDTSQIYLNFCSCVLFLFHWSSM